MPESTEAQRARTRAGTAAVCERGERYRTVLLARIGDAGLVDRAVEALRGDTAVTTALDELDAALQSAGDPHGLYGASRAPRDLFNAAGLAPAVPGESVYLCPAARCSRHWLPDGAATVPQCAVSGTALRRHRL